MDKVRTSPADAISDLADGASIAISGFGPSAGAPFSLLAALDERGTRDLCFVGNTIPPGAQTLVEAGRVRHLIVSFTARAGGSSPAEELIRAIRSVAGGRRYLSADVAQQLALESTSNSALTPFEGLSARELEVAMMLARGRSMPDIAHRLKLSAKTVATYKYRLFEKLNVNNVVTLAHLAAVHGLMDTRATAPAGA